MPVEASNWITKTVRSTDGLKIYAEAAGNPSKPHVVFIHGFSLSGIVWNAQFSDRRLMQRIYAVRYDLRGHGRTDKPMDVAAWSSQRFADDFDAVARAFSLQKPILAGWSYGCTPAVDIVNSFGPNYLSGIIYIGGLPYTDASHIVTPWQSSVALQIQQHAEDPVAYRQALADYLKNMFVNPESLQAEVQQAWLNVMSAQPRAILRRILRREQDKTRFWSEGAAILPLLVIHGQMDNVCSHDALVAEARAKFTNIAVESWQGVGHVPFLEQLEKFNDTVLSWVEKNYHTSRARL